MNESFLAADHVEVSDVKWGHDDYGDYWSARFHDTKTGRKGVTGNYYEVAGDSRPSRDHQEAELRRYLP